MKNNKYDIPIACGVVCGKTTEAVKKQIHEAENCQVEMVEWRLDALADTYEVFLKERENINTCIKMLEDSGKTLILTLRTACEGGFFNGDTRDYFRILHEMEKLFKFDMVDIEYARWVDHEDELHQELPGNSKSRIVSHHDFVRVPQGQSIAALFEKMNKLDVAFIKGAFMAHDFADTLRLMGAALEFKRAHPKRKLIYMAMGESGMATRILTGEAASAISFASLDDKNVAAPGQVELKELTEILKLQGRKG